MTNASNLDAEIMSKLPDVKRGSLVVYGDIFGGRIDNIHVITSASAFGDPERLVIEFDAAETLEVWDPDRATISANEFRIAKATKIRWEWFYYGRAETIENRYFISTSEPATRSLSAPTRTGRHAPLTRVSDGRPLNCSARSDALISASRARPSSA